MRIGEILVREGLLSKQQLAQALKVQALLGDRLGTTLLEEGMIPEDALLKALGRQRSTRTAPAAELASVPAEVVRLIPARLAERYGVVPFHLKGRTLTVASMNAGDLLKEDEIGFLTSCMVRTCIALELRIHEALERCYRIACPQRHRALVRRFAAQPAGAGAPGVRPAGQPSAPARPAVRPAPGRPGAPAGASARSRPSARPAGDRPPAPAPPPLRRFIELDEEDAALLGSSGETSPDLSPASEEPVILEPVPLPWLAREAATRPAQVPAWSPPVAASPPPAVAAAPVPAAPAPPPAAAPVSAAAAPPPAAAPAPGAGAAPGPGAALDGEAALEERLRRAASGLKDAEIRDDIADVLLAFCAPYLRRRAVLVSRKDHIVGWRGEGEGVEREKIRAIEIPVREPSVFLGLTGAGSFWLGSLPPLDANSLLVAGLGGTVPRDCLVLPVTLRSRVVCYLYGDNLEHGVAGAPIAELRRLAAKAGIAFQVYILKNKLRML